MWKKIKVKGLVPTPRNCVSGSATDSLFIVFGGYGRSEKERFSDVFAFNPSGTALRSIFRFLFPFSPSCPLLGACLLSQWINNVFSLFFSSSQSERSATVSSDIQLFRFLFSFLIYTSSAEKKWLQLDMSGDVPTPRYCTSLNFWEDKLVSFGGFDGNRLNTLHLMDTVTWEWKFVVTNSEIPEPRSHHTACVVGNRLIVFGGLSQEGKRLADLHVLDLSTRQNYFIIRTLSDDGLYVLATMTWSQPEVLGKAPLPRLGHISVVLNGNVLAVFGGYGDPDGPYQKFNELNLLHFDTMTWTQPIVTGQLPPRSFF